MAEIEETNGGGGGSILTRKTGPLPNWVWMAIILLLALIYSMWKRNSAGPIAEEQDGPVVEDYPGNSTPPPVFILPQNPQPTVPVNVVVNNPGAPTTPPPAPPVGTRPTPPAAPPAKPKPPPISATHWVVTVDTFTKKDPKWNSTLWGIAEHSGYGKSSNNWSTIWNDPRNATLKKLRGKPENIRKGDKIYVRKK